MAVRVGRLLIGESPEEQLKLEKKRFINRQIYEKKRLEKKIRSKK